MTGHLVAFSALCLGAVFWGWLGMLIATAGTKFQRQVLILGIAGLVLAIISVALFSAVRPGA